VGEKGIAERGEEKMAQSVKDLAAELSLRLVTDMLPQHVLCIGAVKQAIVYSGFIQHQSLSLLFFGGIKLKQCFTAIYGLNLVRCVCTGYIES